MKWFKRPGPEPEDDQQAVKELLDRYHHRASISDGDRLLLQPGQVLENIALAMERLDNDINTPISIEQDVVPLGDLLAMVRNLRLGPLLAVHVVNTAMRIMSARYPMELVRRPFPPEFDLRKLHAMTYSDHEHETAKSIFNQRTASAGDLDEPDVAPVLEPLTADQQVQVFTALFFMFGTKVGAMKYRTGIP
ncbi:hypothetical protein [Actinoplanes aureus]|uniref:Uncharacterized protein n=1 Tax=Actinoplanes aureus TaxID=2792083 RepID=A0A931G3E0_9ACTN|nr:hypothetical protein [Actinoplanes aureus]MBG0569145.1 hypothetical protein [Actinoplanes aureus]